MQQQVETIDKRFQALPSTLQDEISTGFNSGRMDLDKNPLSQYIESKIQDAIDAAPFSSLLKEWLNVESNRSILPFLWDKMSKHGRPSQFDNLRDAIFGLIKYPREVSILSYLPYASLSSLDLKDADLRGANLQGANLSRSDLRGASLQGACLSETNLRESNLTDLVGFEGLACELTKAGSLYGAKINIKTANYGPEDIAKLEDKIIKDYKDYFVSESTISRQSGSFTFSELENGVGGLLTLVQLNGFSPLDWGTNNERFQREFNGNNVFRYVHTVRAVRNTLIEGIRVIIGNENSEGSYLHDRLSTSKPKSFFNPSRHSIRDAQLKSLRVAITANDPTLDSIVDALAKIKNHIDEKEKNNLFPSEMLKKINRLIEDTLVSSYIKVSLPINNNSL